MILVVDYKWLRLITCNKWHKYIKYDSEHIETKNLTIWLHGIVISIYYWLSYHSILILSFTFAELKKFKMIALQKPLIENDVITSDTSDSDSADDYAIADDCIINDDFMIADN